MTTLIWLQDGAIGGMISSALGAALFIFGTRAVQRAKATLTWPRADGTIRAAQVYEYHDSDNDRMFRPEITYEYQVGGVRYEGNKISPGGAIGTSWKSPAEKVVTAFPVGSSCRIYHDPDDPARCFLRPGAPWQLYLAPVVGGIFLAVGAYLLLR